MCVFSLTVFLWLSDRWHGLPASVIALLPAVMLTATGLINRNDLNILEWNVIILIAGGISLGAGMQMTGLDRLVVGWLPLEADTPAWLMLAVLAAATLVMSTFVSNTAASNLILPIGVTALASKGSGASMMATCLCIALTASLAMALPVSTPPNAIAYAQGELNTKDMALPGMLIGLMGALMVVLFTGSLLRLWGMEH